MMTFDEFLAQFTVDPDPDDESYNYRVAINNISINILKQYKQECEDAGVEVDMERLMRNARNAQRYYFIQSRGYGRWLRVFAFQNIIEKLEEADK